MTENGIQGKAVRIFYVDGRTPDGRDHIGQKDGIVIEVNADFLMLQLGTNSANQIGIPKSRLVRVELKNDSESKEVIK
jgi:hypothetical protein